MSEPWYSDYFVCMLQIDIEFKALVPSGIDYEDQYKEMMGRLELLLFAHKVMLSGVLYNTGFFSRPIRA